MRPSPNSGSRSASSSAIGRCTRLSYSDLCACQYAFELSASRPSKNSIASAGHPRNATPRSYRVMSTGRTVNGCDVRCGARMDSTWWTTSPVRSNPVGSGCASRRAASAARTCTCGTAALPRATGTSPGHELAGTIVDGPSGLADVRYAVSPNVACGASAFCLSGRSNLCNRGGYGLGLGRNGGLAELIDAPAVNLAAIPDGVDAVTASLTEPLAVAVRGVGSRCDRTGQLGARSGRGGNRAVRGAGHA